MDCWVDLISTHLQVVQLHNQPRSPPSHLAKKRVSRRREDIMLNRQCYAPHAVQNPDEPGFEIRETPVPDEIHADHVLLKVLACGVCYSDCYPVLGAMGGKFPAIPGHEVIGKVVKVGSSPAAQTFAEGCIVGVGWHGDYCTTCEACTDGDFVSCENQTVCGLHMPGGYQEYMVAPARVLAAVPEGMDPVTAAPLMCAGVTVFNSLRNTNSKAKPPALVAVLGIGGLGHLAIQYAAKFGYAVAAISRGTSKKAQALALGATHYIDSVAENPSAALLALGGAKIILCTGTNTKAMADCIEGLGRNGKLVVLGISTDPIPVLPFQVISKRRSIEGSLTGTGRDSKDAMDFAQLHGITPKTIVFEGIKMAPEAYAAMRKGEYRVVIRVASE